MDNNQCYILDGAIGSFLEEKFPDYKDKNIWMSNIEDNQIIKTALLELYQNYIDNGSNIITTNTFHCDIKELESITKVTKSMVELCQIIKEKNKHILIAGSNGPIELCYNKKRTLDKQTLIERHTYHIKALSGCDFILNETISQMDEIRIVSEICENMNLKYAISILIDNSLSILSGESYTSIIDYLKQKSPYFVGFNCITKEILVKLADSIISNKFDFGNLNVGFYINCGASDKYLNKDFSDSSLITELEFTNAIDYFIKTTKIKPFIIGACCMSNPNYIKQIKLYLERDN